MQALPCASSGTRSITSSENTASKHQQRPAVVPAALASSKAQALLSWQIGQRLGSMSSIRVDYQLMQRFAIRDPCVFSLAVLYSVDAIFSYLYAI
jgi:hypothetical protein